MSRQVTLSRVRIVSVDEGEGSDLKKTKVFNLQGALQESMAFRAAIAIAIWKRIGNDYNISGE